MKNYKLKDGRIVTVIYNDVFPYIVLDDIKDSNE